MRFGGGFGSNIGILLLAIYLILIGIMGFSGNLNLPPAVPNILAIIAGVFLLLGR